MEKQALVLLAHGARDPRWAAPFLRLKEMVQEQLPQVDVELAFLELMQPDLRQTVARLAQAGSCRVTVVPVFLGQGGHVLRDLPAIVGQLQVDHPRLELSLANAVGEDPEVLNAMARYCIEALGERAG